jgi:class 3 adenylate cyclase
MRMSNGYLVAAAADLGAAHEIADGFGLDVIDASSVHDQQTTSTALAGAPNVGLLLSVEAARDEAFVALLSNLATQRQHAQIILAPGDARAAFPFLPDAWPAMSLEDARERASELVRRRQAEAPPADDATRAAPLPAAPLAEASSGAETHALPASEGMDEQAVAPLVDSSGAPAAVHSEPPTVRVATIMAANVFRSDVTSQALDHWLNERNHILAETGGRLIRQMSDAFVAEFVSPTEALAAAMRLQENADASGTLRLSFVLHLGELNEDAAGGLAGEAIELATRLAAAAAPGEVLLSEQARAQVNGTTHWQFDEVRGQEIKGRSAGITFYRALASEAQDSVGAQAPEPVELGAEPAPAAAAPPQARPSAPASAAPSAPRSVVAPSAPADATAFAPSKLRRGTPELVRIAVHQPKDLNAVIKASKKLDPRTEAAPQGMGLGDVAIGSNIGVALEVRGGTCDGSLQRRIWTGEPIDFNFAVEADASVKQVVMLARVFINDAQLGVLAFTRKVSGPGKKPHGPGDRARLKRHKRVFLSYSSKDRETVSAIATAYQLAGVEHFWDRASLKSGEEWHPRLRREIDRADLFHLCWSKSAADSEWVQKEAEHALTRRRKNSGRPEITVQMLDGPPWAPHPSSLDTINFDDFVRAAIVGYARGDGS